MRNRMTFLPGWWTLLRAPDGEGGGGGDGAAGGAGGGGAGGAAGGAGGGADGAGAGGGGAAAGGGGAGGVAGGAGGEGAGAGGAAKPWLETIPLDPALKTVIVNNGFHKRRGDDGQPRDATLEEALASTAQAYDSAQRRLGVNPNELMRRPAEGQTVADWLKKHGDVFGIPEKPGDYGVQPPELPQGVELDQAFLDEALTELHAEGAPKAVVQKAVELYARKIGSMLEQANGEATAARQAMDGELAKDWGAQTEARKALAGRAFQHFAEKAGLDGEAAFGLAKLFAREAGDARAIRFFHAIGEAMGEERMPGGGAPGGFAGAMTPIEANARITAIKAPDGDYARAAAAGDQKKMQELTAEIARLAQIVAPPKGR